MSINPDDLLKNPEQIKQLITLLSGLLPEEQTPDDKPKKTRKKATKRVTKKTTHRTANSKKATRRDADATENKFLDMPEASMFKEDPKIAKKLYQQPPMKRRPQKRKITVTCRTCGKREEISSSLLHGDADRYKCNKCCSNAG